MARAALLVGFGLLGAPGASSSASRSCEDGDVCDTTGWLQMQQLEAHKPSTEEISWFCYEYAFGQDGEWCASEPSVGALELHYSKEGAGPCGSGCECCARAAKVAARAEPLPPVPGRAVEFVTAETRRKEPELWLVPGIKPKNVGFGKDWRQGKLAQKSGSYKEYLTNLVASDPTRLVVLMDTDIGYGGCSEEELLSRYHAIVEASGGASIVSGADAFLYPKDPALGPKLEALAGERREAVFQKLGLSLDAWEAFAPNRQNERAEYIFLNSGFLMGPAKDLLKLVECAIKHAWASDGKFHDQYGTSVCTAENPAMVAIDYSSLVVADMDCMRNNLIQIQGKRIVNNLAGQTQCFVHANGGFKDSLHMKAWLKPATEAMSKLF